MSVAVLRVARSVAGANRAPTGLAGGRAARPWDARGPAAAACRTLRRPQPTRPAGSRPPWDPDPAGTHATAHLRREPWAAPPRCVTDQRRSGRDQIFDTSLCNIGIYPKRLPSSFSFFLSSFLLPSPSACRIDRYPKRLQRSFAFCTVKRHPRSALPRSASTFLGRTRNSRPGIRYSTQAFATSPHIQSVFQARLHIQASPSVFQASPGFSFQVSQSVFQASSRLLPGFSQASPRLGKQSSGRERETRVVSLSSWRPTDSNCHILQRASASVPIALPQRQIRLQHASHNSAGRSGPWRSATRCGSTGASGSLIFLRRTTGGGRNADTAHQESVLTGQS